ncbi:hypothetical protein ID866_5281 [Astraeus odoratus]|nr:hypothetical protein ID866_5281 [Astraeus odoratus]
MPPRRSSRTTRASVTPTSVEAPASGGSKRKRGQSTAPDETEHELEKENVSKSTAKPSSSSSTARRRSTRMSSVEAPSRASRGTRASTRVKLEEVEEEEWEGDHHERAEENEALRARKKSRKSVETEEEDVVKVVEESEPPKRVGRTKRVAASQAAVEVETKADDDETKPASKTRRSSAKLPSANRTSTRAGRKPRRVESDVEEEPEAVPSPDNVSHDSLSLPKGPKKAPEKPKGEQINSRKVSGQVPKEQREAVAEHAQVHDQDTVPTPRPQKSFPATPARQPMHSVPNEGDDDDLEGVEVHFRDIIDMPGPDAYKVIPDSQLVVARTASKNNQSKYSINGRTSSFTEVQTLLKGRGIDLDHKRFLILQMNRLRIVEREKNALEAQRREALDYLHLYNDSIRAKSRLWQWYLWKCLDNEEKYNSQIERYEKELADERDRNKDDITHLEMLEKHFVEREQAYEEVKAAAEEAVKDQADHEKQAVGLEERRKHANSKAKKLKKALQDDEHAHSEAKRIIKECAAKIDKKRAEIEDLETKLKEEEDVLERIRDGLKDKTQVFHDQIEAKQKELQPWTAKINAKKAKIDIATSERDALAKKAAALKDAVKDAQADLEAKQAAQEAKLNELEDLKAKRAGMQGTLQAHAKKFQDAQARMQDLRGKTSSLRQRVEEAKASQAASTSQNKVLDYLTRLKQTGRIEGFHGRLGQLGTIPDKYDVAVSTACGALNNMVVDTVGQAQTCIEFLRKQDVGRASFMIIEKLATDKMNERISTPEGVPRLFDLITFKDPKFASAFYKGLGNTLVADDLDQANRIAFGGSKRWRVVTLAGQLIDASGTMSGGGTKVARGGMSSKLAPEAVRPEVLRDWERESEQASRALEEGLRQVRELEGEAEKLTQAGPQLDMDIQKLSLDINNGRKRLEEAEKRIHDLKAQSKPDARDMARIQILEDDIASATRELEQLQEKSGTIESAIKDLEKKILEIGGSKLLKQKSTVDGIKLHINLANDETTKAEVSKAKSEKDVAKLASVLESNAVAVQEVDKELGKLNQQLAEVNEYLEELKEKVADAQAAAENSKDDLENLKGQLDEKREEIQAFRRKEMEINQALTDVKKEATSNEEALNHWQTEHDKLRLEEIDDDEEEGEEVEASTEAECAEPKEPQVKQENGEVAPLDPKKPRQRQSSTELHIYSDVELAQFKRRDLVADSELLDEKIKNAKPNLSVLKDYKKREEEFLRRAKDLDQITEARDAQKQKYDSLRKQRLDEFMAGFNLISLKLKEMYQMITLGGNAELELVDSMDPFSEGIIFSVMPPKKSWKNISNLSGGEKTLSSLALVFALHVFKPTPLYFMDEIDAALDFRNVSIVANYIKDRTKNAQFIIISLRNDMFELSHRLIGIYKTANATQSIAIDNHALAVVRPQVAAA